MDLADENVQIIVHAFGMTFNGRSEFGNFMQVFKQAFPDLELQHKNIFGNGNKVAVEFTAHGTHSGPLQTPGGVIPPSGKKVEINVAEFYEWENGKIKRMSNYQDAGSLKNKLVLCNSISKK
ncbi:MAG: ester cyclase [Bacteroidetes bacterium]|nr:ester cyclase [Bacteroidota bacterium]